MDEGRPCLYDFCFGFFPWTSPFWMGWKLTKLKERKKKVSSTQSVHVFICMGVQLKEHQHTGIVTPFSLQDPILQSCTYWQNEAILKVRKLLVTLFTAKEAILLVYDFLIAILWRARLIHAILLPKIHNGGNTSKIISLQGTKHFVMIYNIPKYAPYSQHKNSKAY